MSNPFFDAMVKPAAAPQTNQNAGIFGIFEMAKQFKSNPMAFLLQRKLNVPTNIASDPNAILEHLVKTGQITQAQIDAGRQQLQGLRR